MWAIDYEAEKCSLSLCLVPAIPVSQSPEIMSGIRNCKWKLDNKPYHHSWVSEIGIPHVFWPSLPWFLSFLKPGLCLCPAREVWLGSLNSENPSKVCLPAEFLGQVLPPQSGSSLFLGPDNKGLLSCSVSVHVHFSHLQFFELDVYNSDGSPLTTDQLFIQLEKIWNTSLQTNKEPIGILTTNHRNSWAKAYNNLLKGL